MSKRPAIHTQIRSALRRVWSWSSHRREALSSARVAYGKYKCAECGKLAGPKDVAVDHINPCGSFSPDLSDLGPWASRLFFGPLQVLCKEPCHKAKTARERADRKLKKIA